MLDPRLARSVPTPALAGMVCLQLLRAAWRVEDSLYSACATRLHQLVLPGLLAALVRRPACGGLLCSSCVTRLLLLAGSRCVSPGVWWTRSTRPV